MNKVRVNYTRRILFLVCLAISTIAVMPKASVARAQSSQWCSAVKIRFFVGGDAGDAFASIVYKGAQAAQADLGPHVDFIFSGWQVDKMVSQLRDAIAAKPDGIAMMGHPGDDAIMPLAQEASQAGILMEYQNVDVPKVRAMYGGGYIGANLDPQGRALATEALRILKIGKGDHAIVFGAWGQPGRFIREEGTASALEAAGLTVDRIAAGPEVASAPDQLTPLLSAAYLKHPETKLIVYAGGQQLGDVQNYMDAINKKPGEIYNIGFDTSPQVIDSFKTG